MVMELTEGLQIEIRLLLSYLHQHLKKKSLFILLKIGHDHIMGLQVNSFKEEARFMVMELTEGLQIEMCHLLSHLHQHIENTIVYFT